MFRRLAGNLLINSLTTGVVVVGYLRAVAFNNAGGQVAVVILNGVKLRNTALYYSYHVAVAVKQELGVFGVPISYGSGVKCITGELQRNIVRLVSLND